MKVPFRILPVIVFAQFCCTSLWFAGNAVMPNLFDEFGLSSNALGHLTSAVQFGFIAGTLTFAFFTISDRFSPSKVFFICALFGGFINLGILLESNDLYSLIIFRFLTGFSLAGIYPVGMKIASDYFDKGLGRSLGYLVGALVIGTAFPHLLKEISGIIKLEWRSVIYFTSALAAIGGVLILAFVPDGPYRSKRQKPDLSLIFKVFKNNDFRSAAFGYFGHMWELYAFWAFVPVILAFYKNFHPEANFSIAFISFLVIGLGGVACVLSGYISEKVGVKKTAGLSLFLSGLCCLISPLVFYMNSEILLMGFLIFWGLVVVADSPLFSTLVAKNTEAESRGTALTIVNCIGFSITIISIQMLNYFNGILSPALIFVILSIGPIFGLTALFRKPKLKG
ncbi:MFS transporter [Christiangramia echinicola]|uniref:Predicted arabinose efflux permease, MFS family n=1 Tax=Christiangramia echinicola TaxID=279359 RepID=A0A1H1Q813_9FLAO|nr:MFS transporter [Christiangramia echinicola]SDS19658.1 Predicted arabinose efflux permease, MFS family [Christiangramia echinicola]